MLRNASVERRFLRDDCFLLHVVEVSSLKWDTACGEGLVLFCRECVGLPSLFGESDGWFGSSTSDSSGLDCFVEPSSAIVLKSVLVLQVSEK